MWKGFLSYLCLMKLLLWLFNFYINASIHVALAVYALVRITEKYLGLPYNEPVAYTAFYGTITAYNFVKYASLAKFKHASLTVNLRYIQVFSLLCFGCWVYYVGQLPARILWCLVPFGLLTLLYTIPFYKGFKKNLRSEGVVKVLIVASVWVGVTVMLPVLQCEQYSYTNVLMLGAQRFLLVVVWVLPFDIRDMNRDELSLRTLPKRLGVAQTKKLGILLLAICLILEFNIMAPALYHRVFLALFGLTAILLMRATPQQHRYYSSFWVEALPIFWLILLIVFVNFL